jgi:glycerophosphoryl diester phosphodiesterase
MLPEAKFNLDIKCEGAVAPTVGVIVQTKAHNRVLVSSFSQERRLRALELLKNAGLIVATSADGSVILALAWAAFTGNYEAFLRKTRGLCALQIPTSYFGISLTFKRLLSFAIRAEVEVHYWVINDEEQMRKLVRLGARGIVTDRADLAATNLR